ncbi:DUF6884 domain-containing protein [Streptomyces noursei]|uniref:DUF6884 domain-containing protein n=1 Tax=Streptomyces noursei TaxID=1971 RepID=UPI003804F360
MSAHLQGQRQAPTRELPDLGPLQARATISKHLSKAAADGDLSAWQAAGLRDSALVVEYGIGPLSRPQAAEELRKAAGAAVSPSKLAGLLFAAEWLATGDRPVATAAGKAAPLTRLRQGNSLADTSTPAAPARALLSLEDAAPVDQDEADEPVCGSDTKPCNHAVPCDPGMPIDHERHSEVPADAHRIDWAQQTTADGTTITLERHRDGCRMPVRRHNTLRDWITRTESNQNGVTRTCDTYADADKELPTADERWVRDVKAMRTVGPITEWTDRTINYRWLVEGDRVVHAPPAVQGPAGSTVRALPSRGTFIEYVTDRAARIRPASDPHRPVVVQARDLRPDTDVPEHETHVSELSAGGDRRKSGEFVPLNNRAVAKCSCGWSVTVDGLAAAVQATEGHRDNPQVAPQATQDGAPAVESTPAVDEPHTGSENVPEEQPAPDAEATAALIALPPGMSLLPLPSTYSRDPLAVRCNHCGNGLLPMNLSGEHDTRADAARAAWHHYDLTHRPADDLTDEQRAELAAIHLSEEQRLVLRYARDHHTAQYPDGIYALEPYPDRDGNARIARPRMIGLWRAGLINANPRHNDAGDLVKIVFKTSDAGRRILDVLLRAHRYKYATGETVWTPASKDVTLPPLDDYRAKNAKKWPTVIKVDDATPRGDVDQDNAPAADETAHDPEWRYGATDAQGRTAVWIDGHPEPVGIVWHDRSSRSRPWIAQGVRGVDRYQNQHATKGKAAAELLRRHGVYLCALNARELPLPDGWRPASWDEIEFGAHDVIRPIEHSMGGRVHYATVGAEVQLTKLHRYPKGRLVVTGTDHTGRTFVQVIGQSWFPLGAYVPADSPSTWTPAPLTAGNAVTRPATTKAGRETGRIVETITNKYTGTRTARIDIGTSRPLEVDAGQLRPAPGTRVYIVPCGGAKATTKAGKPLDAAPAGELYVGSYHKACRKAADHLAMPVDTVLILSAKFGLVPLDEWLPTYDLKAGDPGTVDATTLRAQARALRLDTFPTTVFGGRAYVDLARQVWDDITAPLEGCAGIGEHLSRLAAIYGDEDAVPGASEHEHDGQAA